MFDVDPVTGSGAPGEGVDLAALGVMARRVEEARYAAEARRYSQQHAGAERATPEPAAARELASLGTEDAVPRGEDLPRIHRGDPQGAAKNKRKSLFSR